MFGLCIHVAVAHFKEAECPAEARKAVVLFFSYRICCKDADSLTLYLLFKIIIVVF